MIKVTFFFLLLAGFKAETLSLDAILRANDAVSLNSYIKKSKNKAFLKILCENQKKSQAIPTACYELSLKADMWCLNLKNLRIKALDQALKSSFLSSSCRDHLKRKRKLLLYREKDKLLPELRNYWADDQS